MNRIFISYRIADCADLVGRLDADLTRAFGRDAVFRDKTRIEGGTEWTTEIEEHAKSCKIMLVVIGPGWQSAAFADGDRKGFPRLSDPEDWVRREILLALDAGNIVIPVLANGATLPPEGWLANCGLGRLHAKQGVRLERDDYDAHFAALLTTLRAHCPELTTKLELPAKPEPPPTSGRRDFYQHVAMPPNYVPRGPVLAALAKLLLSDHKAVALTSGMLAKPAALHGMGGVGKSVLARALCNDPEIRAAFPDGILWTTLGQTPNLKSCLREWLDALGVSVPESAPTINVLAEALARALEPRACLLVVDDLWVADHLRTFTIAGPRCRLLITTRSASLARQFGARIHPVGAMAADEALRLLEAWADGQLAETPAPIKDAILDKLGALPLAIKLAGAQLQRIRADRWLATFESALELDAGGSAPDRESSVAACFRLSMDALDERSRQLYAGLGIFREDEPIPVAAVAKLWSEWVGATEREAQRLCYSLADHALVELVHGGDALVLHDLIRQMTVDLLGDQEPEAHRRLLAAYAKTRSGQSWATAADDGYLYDHLAYHLAGAHDVAGLRRLFDDHEWMWARLRRSDHRVDGYLDDLDRFWRIATAKALEQIAADGSPDALVDCVRCSLIQTSLNSGTATYPPQVMARAVELGLWSLDRALSTLQRVPDNGRRFDGLVALLELPTLTREARYRVTEIAVEVGVNEPFPVENLRRLAPHAVEPQVPRILTLMLSHLRSNNVIDLPGAAAAILPRIDKAQLLALLDSAEALPALYGTSASRHLLLIALVPRLPEDLLERALGIAIDTQSAARIAAVVAFFPRINAARRHELVDLMWAEALAMAPAKPRYSKQADSNIRAHGLAQLAPHLSADRRREASSVCAHDLRALQNEEDVLNVLEAFGQFFETEDLTVVLDVVRRLAADTDHGWLAQVRAVAQLAGRLYAAGIEEPIGEVVDWAFRKGQGMWFLAPSLPSSWRTRCLDRLLVENSPEHDRIAAELLPHLTLHDKETLLRARSVAALLEIDTVFDRKRWKQVVHDLSPNLFDSVVRDMIAFPDKGNMFSDGELSGFYSIRESRLMDVAGRLSAQQVQRCMSARGRTRDELAFVYLIVHLLAVLPEREPAIAAAVDAALRMPEEENATPPARELAFAALAPHLSLAQQQTCLELIERGRIPLTQVFGLAALLPSLQDERRRRALESATSKANAVAISKRQYPLALAAVVPFLSHDARLTAASEVFMGIHLNWDGHETALETVLPYLQPDELRRLLTLTIAFPSSRLLPDIVGRVILHMTEGEIRELAKHLGEQIVDYSSTSREPHCLARLRLVPYLASAQADAIIGAVLDLLGEKAYLHWYQEDVYASILDELPAEARRLAAEIALDYLSRAHRIGALRALIPRVDGTIKNTLTTRFLEDVLALDGLQAVMELAMAFPLLLDSNEHRRLLCHELVQRLYANRSTERREVLNTLSSEILSEALFPREVLSAIAAKVITLYCDWTWP